MGVNFDPTSKVDMLRVAPQHATGGWRGRRGKARHALHRRRVRVAASRRAVRKCYQTLHNARDVSHGSA